jgi:hypothetical protein
VAPIARCDNCQITPPLAKNTVLNVADRGVKSQHSVSCRMLDVTTARSHHHLPPIGILPLQLYTTLHADSICCWLLLLLLPKNREHSPNPQSKHQVSLVLTWPS